MPEPRGACQRMIIRLVANATTKHQKWNYPYLLTVTDKGKEWGNNTEYYNNQGILNRKVVHNNVQYIVPTF
jgi:hypothetical protein